MCCFGDNRQWCSCEKTCHDEILGPDTCELNCNCEPRSYLVTGVAFLVIGAACILVAASEKFFSRCTNTTTPRFSSGVLGSLGFVLMSVGTMWTTVGARYHSSQPDPASQCSSSLWTWLMSVATVIVVVGSGTRQLRVIVFYVPVVCWVTHTLGHSQMVVAFSIASINKSSGHSTSSLEEPLPVPN